MPEAHRAILATLVYADVFDYPLTRQECYFYLISKTPLSVTELRQALSQLTKNKKIKSRKGFYFLPGRKQVILSRGERSEFAKKKLILAKQVAGVIGFIPSVRLVGITGALSMQNTSKDDDIDLMVITSNGTLWITRLLVTLLVVVIGKKRFPQQQKVGDKICLNMYIDESALDMGPHDLFIAHEIVQMVPMVDKRGTYQKFMQANLWIRSFLPHAFGRKAKSTRGEEKQISQWPLSFTLNALRSLEAPARGFQLWYMRSKITTEKVTKYELRFHPNDIRRKVLACYQQGLDRLEKTGGILQ
ncbi:hypothetical protein HY388_01350 [Candidatus Daviesbacteria bacterium]|nr:hypothetical protein [Candidatus Daviesbacteria bacterium]